MIAARAVRCNQLLLFTDDHHQENKEIVACDGESEERK